ncbi:MAG: hypothetical protein FJY86_00805 [Candidatus Diapherotrites archaeon]|uniref:Uncharacterized protein n=1 Tax=Candidatus Iainarchaeum sp. TaxID=3101447 RepID=A0A8T4C9M9_9ARCH|nr:hypothetical protein [Candidatus Diapherotrites archaeon]
MPNAPSARPGLFAGLAKVLHLHQLPRNEEKTLVTAPKREPSAGEILPVNSPMNNRITVSTPKNESFIPSPITKTTPPSMPSQPVKKNNSTTPIPVTTPLTKSPSSPRWPVNTHPSSSTPVSKGMIITDYDRILELVKTNHPVKLDEIARILTMKEEQVAQELQTLEDNGLVEVKYPAFGEPLIYYKQPEA